MGPKKEALEFKRSGKNFFTQNSPKSNSTLSSKVLKVLQKDGESNSIAGERSTQNLINSSGGEENSKDSNSQNILPSKSRKNLSLNTINLAPRQSSPSTFNNLLYEPENQASITFEKQ